MQVKSIIIVGSGAGAWTLAAWLGELMHSAPINLTLIDLGEPSALAESSGSSIGRFNDIIALPEKQLIQQTQTTFSYGLYYQDWGASGRSFLVAEAAVGEAFRGVPFSQVFARAQQLGLAAAYDQYSLAACAARQDRFAHPQPKGIYASLSYGLHLDLAGYAQQLQAKALAAGVVHITSAVTCVQLDARCGYVTGVQLENGVQLACDLILDCSAGGHLVRAQLKVPETTNSLLPVYDTGLIAVRKLEQSLGPYGCISATAAGVISAIPLQKQMIYHYHYNSDPGREVAVLDELSAMGAEPLHALPGTSGNHKVAQFWQKNYIAMGAAAYQLPRLHFGVLAQLRNEVARLGDLLTSFADFDLLAQEYNRLTLKEYQELSELTELQLFLAGAGHADASQGLSEGARHRYQLFAGHGRTGGLDSTIMSAAQYRALFLGCDLVPQALDPRLAAVSDEEIIQDCRRWLAMTAQAVAKLPTQAEYIQRLMTL